MKSMRGFRRFISDYGFEGVFSHQNVMKMRHGASFVSGFAMLTGCAITWIWKLHEDVTPTGCFVEAFANEKMLENFDKETKTAIFSRSLHRKGLSHDRLVIAATHLAPIESQILELKQLFCALGSLDYPISRYDLEATLKVMGMGSVLRDLVRIVPEQKLTGCETILEYVTDALIDVWISRGYFLSKSYPNPDAFGNRQTSEAIGVDIGSTVRTALSGDELDQQVSMTGIRRGLVPLQQLGFVLVKSAVNPIVLLNLQKLLKIDGQPSGEIGSSILSYDANISHSRASANRLQLVLRGSKIEKLTEVVHTAIVPIVTAYYDRKGITSRVVLSDLRIVVVDHAAHELPWTAYNPRGGVSVMIPLQNHDSRSGAQRFLPGSHLLLNENINIFKRLFMFIERYRMFKRPINISDLYPDGAWKSGDAFIFDNRLMIRGCENTLFRSGTYLLAKYETADEFPNAFYLGGKVWYRFAQFLEGIAPFCANEGGR